MHSERSARNVLGLASFLSVALCGNLAHAACGDGVVDTGETCDDANTAASDGCNAACQIEAGYGCSGAPSLCCFSAAGAAYVLQGNSSYAAATGEVTLVPDLNNQVGVAWFKQTLDFTRAFRINLRLFLGSRDADPLGNSTGADGGADGGAVLFQRDPRGTAAQGTYGGELGAQGIVPVVGVEFDTYNNGATYDDVTTGDEDHVSIFQTRATPASNHIAHSVCLNNGTTCANYEDGKYHAFSVEWTGAADHHMRVYVDGALRIDLADDLITNYFAGDPTGIYFGFAASTGGSRNLHKFCPAAPVGFRLPRDFDGDGIDDAIDLDDDDDGRPDGAETNNVFGGDDPSGDHDNDGIPNYQDPDYWTNVVMRPVDCPDVVAPVGACDSLPKTVDFDGDGIPDQLDRDSDGDTVTDAEEDGNPDTNHDGVLDGCIPTTPTGLCPGTRPAVPDTDGDGQIDSRDPDSDGDGVLDNTDPARLDPCIPNPQAAACKTGDSDNDGLSNGVECPNANACVDTNADGTPDYLDPDQDDDGALDGADPAPRDPCIPNAQALTCPTGDTDGDGVPNGTDTGKSDPCVPDANALACPTGDHDGDGVPNSSDAAPSDPCIPNASSTKCAGDGDNDGVPNMTDPAPSDPCVPDVNALACAAGDHDGDGVPNGTDPQPSDPCIPNASSPACNGDGDKDGVPNASDPQPSDPCVPDANALACATGDHDGDGVPNGGDPKPEDPCIPNASSPACNGDGDDDGVPNKTDTAPSDPCVPDANALACGTGDHDGDGTPNSGDPKPSDPCIPNASSTACATADTDHDGVPNGSDPKPTDPCVPDANALACGTGDPDHDGLPNDFECPGLTNCRDSDGDGLPDYNDPDSDNDGSPDSDECTDPTTCNSDDTDGDGIPDLLDPDHPVIAGGACSVSAQTSGPLPSVGWLFATLIAWLVGRRWRHLGLRHAAREQARARDA